MQECVDMQMYIFQPEYASLSVEEKAALLEQGICPASVALPGCDVMRLNFAMDWQLLKPVLVGALNDIQTT